MSTRGNGSYSIKASLTLIVDDFFADAAANMATRTRTNENICFRWRHFEVKSIKFPQTRMS